MRYKIKYERQTNVNAYITMINKDVSTIDFTKKLLANKSLRYQYSLNGRMLQMNL